MKARTSARNASVSASKRKSMPPRVGRAVAAAASSAAAGAPSPQRRVGDRAQLGARVAQHEARGLGPAHVELHVVLEHEAVAAVHVEAEPGGLLGHLAAVPRRLCGTSCGAVGSSSSRAQTAS